MDIPPVYFWYLLATSSIGPFLFGYHLAELNAPQDVLTCLRKTYAPTAYLSPLPQCIQMSTFQFGFVSSIFTIGGLFGALGAGKISNRLGRLSTMRFTTAFFIFGSLAAALANSVPLMALGRFVSGLGSGISTVVAPIYIANISPPGQKGFFGFSTQVMINTGILLTQGLGLFLSKGALWRIILGVAGIIGLHQCAALFFSVESPVWSAENGHFANARRDLQRIRGRDANIRDELRSIGIADTELLSSEDDPLLAQGEPMLPATAAAAVPAVIADKPESLGIFEVILHPQYSKSTIIVMIIMVAQQFTGINSIVMYGVHLLSDVFKSSSALLNVVVAFINVFITIICAPLPDRIGRKKTLFFSITGMGVSALLLGIAIQRNVSILSAITVLTFVGSFGLGLGPVPFILASELVGPEAVGATQSWALAASWISTFIVAQFFPILDEALGKGKVYFVFAILAACFAYFVGLHVPETKGLRDNSDELRDRPARQRRES